jgi:hypothetical protein
MMHGDGDAERGWAGQAAGVEGGEGGDRGGEDRRGGEGGRGLLCSALHCSAAAVLKRTLRLAPSHRTHQRRYV